jgi:hypothetical protein
MMKGHIHITLNIKKPYNMFENYNCQVRYPKARDIFNNSPCVFIISKEIYLPIFLIILCYFQDRGLSLNLPTLQG